MRNVIDRVAERAPRQLARMLGIGLLLAAGLPVAGAEGNQAGMASERAVVSVFRGAMVHFHPDSAGAYADDHLVIEENGRIVRTEVKFPELDTPGRIRARLVLHPVPKGDREVADRWDRAGNVRLVTEGRPDLEIVRFMTSYGGRTEHEVDVSELAPLLRGARSLRAFVDTWVSPGWRIDCQFDFEPDTSYDAPSWAVPAFYCDSFNRQDHEAGAEVTVTIPPGLARVVLRYISTGHCTDGRDEDEFVSKANVISVDGRVVARIHPWRDDCRRFRERNPYCARWSDGSWSSDYSRSGWCPGVEVTPVEFDLSDALTAGEHTLRFVIEEMRPKDEDGHFGYWRVSASLIGWDRMPQLWRN